MTNNFEKDINVPSKRLDRIDKMEIDLANYEQMERDIEKITEPYQLNWELDCLSLPTAIQSILERKEQECEFSNLRIIQLQETLSQYETDLSTKDCIVETCKAQYKELKAENEKLEEEIAKARMEICNQCSERDDYNIPCKQIRDLDYGLQLEIENIQLKQTLTEIKEIAEKEVNNRMLFADKESFCDFNKILQKISEVENES